MTGSRDFVAALSQVLDDLSPKQLAIARRILECPGVTHVASARELAAHVGADPATVVRSAQALGSKGYADLQQQLRHQYLASLSPQALTADQAHHVNEDNVVSTMLRLDLANLHVALDNLDAAALSKLADASRSCQRMLAVSAGSYAAPAIVLGHLGQSMGCGIEVEVRGGTFLAATLASLHDGDAVLGISFWRGYRETVQAVEWARSRGLATYAITDSVFSPLARAADHSLIVPTEGLFFFQSMTAALSTVYGLASLLWLRGARAAERSMERMRGLYTRLGTFLDEGDVTC